MKLGGKNTMFMYELEDFLLDWRVFISHGILEIIMASTRKASRKEKKGSRKAKKGTRKASPWNMAVKRVYEEMKRKDRNAKFGDALKEASKRKKNGTL